MEGDIVEPLAKTFFALMDNHRQDWSSILHEDAVLDWFGRCIVGIIPIRTFVRELIEQTSHSIDSIKTCPPIRHRCLTLKRKKRTANPIQEIQKTDKAPDLVECGQGDGWGVNITPPASSIPYDESILKAPRYRKFDFKFDENEELYFKKIRGTLRLKVCENDERFDREKIIKHIIIAHTDDRVKLIVYEGVRNCIRSLVNQF